jgi:threonine synthase
MRYISTRDATHSVPLSAAIRRGLAPDGGLYVPSAFPSLSVADFDGAEDLPATARRLLRPFFAGDGLAPALDAICAEAFSFAIPLRSLARDTAVLELFHGPTAAFKDVGARFLASCLSRLVGRDEPPLTILVATSGDTGGAVAAACSGKPGLEVVVLYPQGMVSPRQEKQLTGWAGNVTAYAVQGDFDACQRLVKQALTDADLHQRLRMTSANSINIGRLLPQMVYYAWASLRYRREHGADAGFIVPTGNVGNAAAALWAREAGLPIREVVLATNANRTIVEYFDGGEWTPRPTVATLATAMDVGNPSNMERVFHLFPRREALAEVVRAAGVTDDEIRAQIRRGRERWGEVWDPHTATAVAVRERLDSPHWVLVSTAHPAKFEGVVEPLVGAEVPVPEELRAVLDRPSRSLPLPPEYAAFRQALLERNRR